MAVRRITRRKVDDLALLRAELAEVQARYDREIEAIKAQGAHTYPGNLADLVISRQFRSTTDWERIRRKYKIPNSVIARATRDTPYLRADIVRKPS